MEPMKSPNLISSFRNALAGLDYALRTQRNAKIHLVIMLLVLAAGLWLGLSLEQWCLVILASGMVWMAELSNTAIETAVDLASPEYHPLAKIAKDVKAAVVIVAAISSVLVGLLVFGPALLAKLGILLR